MCGRFTFVPTQNLKARFNLKNDLVNLQANYNVSPGQFLPIIINQDGNLVILMRWGLIPSWSRNLSRQFNLINARAESVTTKPSFRKAFQSQHCLVPASGFFEWKKEAKTKKPYYFQLQDESLFSFAGIWSNSLNADGSEIQTFSIITTEANDIVKPIHDRMPVILTRKDEDLWLDQNPNNLVRHINLLKPYSSDLMTSYPVSPKINRTQDNQPDLIKPIT
jgi:putative SOS response-associated peptidase YedK